MVVFSFIVAILLSVLFITLYLFKKKKEEKKLENSEDLNWFSIGLIIVSVSTLIFSIYAPFILTRQSLDAKLNFTQTGLIGDTIGGIMNPIVAFAGVIITGLAFYMQFKANKLQRELFQKEQKESKEQFQIQLDSQEANNKFQQFESQFYEMIRLHKENVNELELTGFMRLNPNNLVNFGHDQTKPFKIEKRKVFTELVIEFELILSEVKKSDNPILNRSRICDAYEYFFWGVFPKSDNNISIAEAIDRDDNNNLRNRLLLIKNKQFDTEEWGDDFDIKGSIRLFDGHSDFLGHYFRHLFHTVKFVVSQEGLDYNKKRKYLRVLRAQLSNNEQAMLFYNWLSYYGNAWEDSDNQFFTEYSMIHNLWHNRLFDDDFIKETIKDLDKKSVDFRIGDMFEIPLNY